MADGWNLNNPYSIHIGFYIFIDLQFLQSFLSLFYNTPCVSGRWV